MADGEGCRCYATSVYECCCEDVDWRSEREIELEDIVQRYKEALERIYFKGDTKPQMKNIAWKALSPALYGDVNNA